MSFLTDSDIARIHETSLVLLETVGAKVDHPEIRRRLMEAGAEGNVGRPTVRFPRDLVASCVNRAPRNIRFSDRCGQSVQVGADG